MGITDPGVPHVCCRTWQLLESPHPRETTLRPRTRSDANRPAHRLSSNETLARLFRATVPLLRSSQVVGPRIDHATGRSRVKPCHVLPASGQ